MVVCTWKWGENISETVFHGDLDQCRAYCWNLEWKDYESIDICDDTGLIIEYVK